MKKIVFLLFALLTGISASAQNSPFETLTKFANAQSQEKVYLHLDNNCYFVGDTIWFKAYVTRADNNKMSDLSRILYVELLTPDGYLVERHQVPISTEGNGFGDFVLLDSLYSGYYELRAYTRWQLNFGRYEHEHPAILERNFYNKKMAKDFYRDYDKLYSRVFPVYDKPATPGKFNKLMTTRPLRRYFSSDDEKTEITLTFFPEGGNLVAGTTNRVAFETADQNGRHVALDGGVVKDASGNVVAQLSTTFRGKGSFDLPCGSAGQKFTAETTYKGKTFSASLPEVLPSGCIMNVDALGEKDINVKISAKGLPAESVNSLAYSLMRGGKVQKSGSVALGADGTATLALPKADLATGVHELTLFDAKGEVFADRLFFVNRHEYEAAQIIVSGQKSEYKPFEPITLNFSLKNRKEPVEFSLAVRDRSTDEPTYDTSNLLTEMLLGSEVKGFIENPAYYFEADDNEHRQNLDLLLRVQGWRRYVWRDMAGLTDYFKKNPIRMPETRQMLEGSVHKFVSNLRPEDIEDASWMGVDENEEVNETNTSSTSEGENRLGLLPGSNLKKEVYVKARFHTLDQSKPEERNGVWTKDGKFKLLTPQYFGWQNARFLALDEEPADMKVAEEQEDRLDKEADSIQQEKTDGKNTKIKISLSGYPDYYVKRELFFPLFPKTYSFYQENSPEYSDTKQKKQSQKGDRVLDEVTIRTKRGGLRKVDYTKPAYVIDAYQMFNHLVDVGLNDGYLERGIYFENSGFGDQIAFALTANMGTVQDFFLQQRVYEPFMQRSRALNTKEQYIAGRTQTPLYVYRHPTITTSKNEFGVGEKDKDFRLSRFEKIYIYTDYEPRHEGAWSYSGSNRPEFIIEYRLLPNDGKRPVSTNRRVILPGYSGCDDFYRPDYSRTPLPTVKDYRRTLYWEPVVQTNAEGKATVTFYNNAAGNSIAISAEGLTKDGVPAVNQTDTEDILK